mmetsp:Transcript_51684/g.126075  ORF Transcript_51684/g.126075 Transcript_51684/m.126075 type:complete len:299 (-) Transcript_51684:224-1120(-)
MPPPLEYTDRASRSLPYPLRRGMIGSSEVRAPGQEVFPSVRIPPVACDSDVLLHEIRVHVPPGLLKHLRQHTLARGPSKRVACDDVLRVRDIVPTVRCVPCQKDTDLPLQARLRSSPRHQPPLLESDHVNRSPSDVHVSAHHVAQALCLHVKGLQHAERELQMRVVLIPEHHLSDVYARKSLRDPIDDHPADMLVGTVEHNQGPVLHAFRLRSHVGRVCHGRWTVPQGDARLGGPQCVLGYAHQQALLQAHRVGRAWGHVEEAVGEAALLPAVLGEGQQGIARHAVGGLRGELLGISP